jgi:enediyne biosynthesis protein E4
VSQPGDRGAHVSKPGKLDAKLGEFWVDSPWEIVRNNHNLSAYERKRLYLNLHGQSFADISYLSGADNDGDGRSVVAGDFRNNGQLDLVVRQVGGGPLLLYENCFPKRHYLEVSLRGKQSNRQGVGARLTASVAGQALVREMYPVNSFRSQMPNVVHFGLGDATKLDRLTIRWPSGKLQEFTNLTADRHIIVNEEPAKGDGVQTVVPGQSIAP